MENKTDLIPVEYNQERILTTEQLAEVYGAEPKNIHDNFSNHKKKFMDKKHYYFLEGEELKLFKNSLPDNIGVPLKFA